MKETLIDTDILSYYFKGDRKVVENFQKYLGAYSYINIPIITYYEILRGLKYQKAIIQIERFEKFISSNNLIFITKTSVEISAERFAELQIKGKTIGTSDLLIAGIALQHNLTVVTNNEKHYNNISGLSIENWKKR
jgi:tRNA(fMet)-specific endonuclease VapC